MSATKKSNIPIEPVKVIISPAESPAPAAPIQPVAPVASAAPLSPIPPQQIGPGDEHTWGMLAHLSVLLNLVTGFLGPVVALVIYLVYKDRSRSIAYQALQSMIFQLIWWHCGGILAGICGAIAGIFFWTIIIPIVFGLMACLFALLPLGALIYGIIGATQVNQGRDFKYWLVGDWVRGTLTG
jgi:uncharacterized protein